jgi:hypothetical protein
MVQYNTTTLSAAPREMMSRGGGNMMHAMHNLMPAGGMFRSASSARGAAPVAVARAAPAPVAVAAVAVAPPTTTTTTTKAAAAAVTAPAAQVARWCDCCLSPDRVRQPDTGAKSDAEKPAADAARDGSSGGSDEGGVVCDYTALPAEIDNRLDAMVQESTVRPTTISGERCAANALAACDAVRSGDNVDQTIPEGVARAA